MFLPTELRVLAMSHSLQSRKSLRRGGSNCVKLESPSNERWTGQRVDVRSIFVIRRATLLSSLLQPFGVAVGDFDSLTEPNQQMQRTPIWRCTRMAKLYISIA